MQVTSPPAVSMLTWSSRTPITSWTMRSMRSTDASMADPPRPSTTSRARRQDPRRSGSCRAKRNDAEAQTWYPRSGSLGDRARLYREELLRTARLGRRLRVTRSRLSLTRRQILAFRRHVGALDERLPRGPRSLRRAAWAGLQDSMPRAALLSIHARVEGTEPSTWEDPSLVQLWGPRYNVFVVAECDLAVFSLGTLPDDARGLRRAEDLAVRLNAVLGNARMSYGEAGRALGVHPNSLRYAAAT